MLSRKMILTDHVIWRAKQRMNLKSNHDSLLFESELKDIFEKAEFRYFDNNDEIYEFVHLNKNNENIVFKLIVKTKDGVPIIQSVIPKK